MNRTKDKNQLTYRLREKVRYSETGGSLYLTLDYPLKVLVIHPAWGPVIRLLHTREVVPFHDIMVQLAPMDPQKIEIFLNGLVRKGLLESRGYLHLNEYPSVSVIIPVRNRPQEIEACLQSLTKLDYPPKRIETIVVDDASDDGTPRAAEKYGVLLIPLKERRQASFCRNLAARRAGGEILAFLDSDCTASPLWLKELVPAFGDPTTGVVGGMVDSTLDHKGLDRYEKVRSSLNMGPWPRSSREGDPFFYVPSCNLLARKELFRRIGGFKEEMVVGEDVDLCWRMQDLGFHTEYRPAGRVYHKHRNDIGGFCGRRFDYGTSEPFLQRGHPGRIKKFVYTFPDLLFWGSMFLSVFPALRILLGLSGVTLVADSAVRFGRLRRLSLPIRFRKVIPAVLREYIAFIYNACAFVSRYYLLCIIPVFLFFPVWAGVLLGAHLITAAVEYAIRKPRLWFLSFLFYFTLDQISYQAGVWWGCIRWLYFGPVSPVLARKPLLKERS